jgi:hypothetical protein
MLLVQLLLLDDGQVVELGGLLHLVDDGTHPDAEVGVPKPPQELESIL